MGLFDFAFGFSNNNAQVGLNKWDTDWLYQQQSDRWRSNTDWFNNYGYSQMRAGLERAGYNPLMALGATPMSGATVSGAVMDERSNASSFNTSGVPLGVEAFRAQMRNVNADTTLKNAQTEENISRSNLENTQKILSDKEIPFKDRMLASTLLGVELQNRITEATVGNVNADTNLKRIQSNFTRRQIDEINQNIKLLRKQNIISDKQAKYLKEHPVEAQNLLRASMYTGVIGNIFGGNFGYTMGSHSTKVEK